MRQMQKKKKIIRKGNTKNNAVAKDLFCRLVSLAMLKNTTRLRFTAGDCFVSRHRG